MKEPEPFMNARAAARYLGYDVSGGPSRTDPKLRAFYAFASHHGIKKYHRGRGGRCLCFKRVDLDAAMEPPQPSRPAPSDVQARHKDLGALARFLAAGGDVRA